MVASLALIAALGGFDLREFERARAVALAEAALASEPRAITSAVNPRSAGGPHDFSSEGDYWWPDPANPGGPYIRRDGMTNPDNFTVHRELMMGMARDVGALAAAWDLTRMARCAGVSEESLRRLCQRYLKRSPMAQLTRMRMQAAADILRYTDEKLASVALRLGYADAFSFSAAFKRTMGRSPQTFRKRGRP